MAQNRTLNWFPGHMKKSLEEIKAKLKAIDVVLYIMDARAIASSVNPSLDRLFEGKTIIYCFNKTDLANPAVTNDWLNYYNKTSNSTALQLNSLNRKDIAELLKKVNIILEPKRKSYRDKRVNKTFRLMVAGIPNSGKSTVINALCGGKKTITGDRPGVTKGQQWVKIGDYLEILDTPGTLYPRFEDQQTAKHIAIIGSISANVIDHGELAINLLARLRLLSSTQRDIPKMLNERYGLNDSDENVTALEVIAKRRGALLKGQPDVNKAALFLIDDFRKGKLGRISLDIC